MSHTDDLRKMSAGELEKLGQDSLREHIAAQAVVVHHKYSPLTFDKLKALLQDPECVRHSTRLVYEFGEMALHQFAQPDIDWRDTELDGRVLYLRPILKDRPELVVQAVAYMIPLINYGDIINDEHCLIYGATLLGMLEQEFYTAICRLADFVGAEHRLMGSIHDLQIAHGDHELRKDELHESPSGLGRVCQSGPPETRPSEAGRFMESECSTDGASLPPVGNCPKSE